MAREPGTNPEAELKHMMEEPVQDRAPLSQREVEQLQDIIIRAHYVATELRDICAVSHVGSRHLCLAVSHMVKSWALSFAEELERTVERQNSP